jgi:hypothetical protein
MANSTGQVSEADSSSGDEGSSSASDLLLKVLGAIGTGLGILGFVTFFGGAILWLRADKAELPATEAVAVIPHGVLVTTGATFLVPAVLIAVAVVVLIFLVYLGFGLRRRKNEKGRRDKAKDLHRRADASGRSAEAAVESAKAARAVLLSLEETLTAAIGKPEAAAAVPRLQEAINDQRVETERLELGAQSLASAAATAKANADNLTESIEYDLERTPVQCRIELIGGALALLLIPTIANGAIFHVGFGLGLLLLVVAAAGAAIAVFVYSETDKFIWFGIVAFVTVGIYIGLATYISTHRNAKMQPVAALRAGHQPVTGAFIADTSENLYLGSFREAGKPPRLIVIPRSQVTEFTVGPLLDRSAARQRAIAMALDECDQKEEAKDEHGASQEKPACTEEQETQLKEAEKVE